MCDAAERLFAERGAEAVTIRQLAAQLGVSPMTPYRYFKDKDAILAAVRARGFDRHADALEGAWRQSRANPTGRGEAVRDAYIRFAFDHPQAYKLMFDISQPTEGEYPDLVRAASRSRATMTLHLEQEVASGRLTEDPQRIGHMYWAALHGPIMLAFCGMLAPGCDAPGLIRGLLKALDAQTFGPRGEA